MNPRGCPEPLEAAFARAAALGKVSLTATPGGIVRAEIALPGADRRFARGAGGTAAAALGDALAEAADMDRLPKPPKGRCWYCERRHPTGWSSELHYGRAPHDLGETPGEVVVATASGTARLRRIKIVPEDWIGLGLAMIRAAIEAEAEPEGGAPHEAVGFGAASPRP